MRETATSGGPIAAGRRERKDASRQRLGLASLLVLLLLHVHAAVGFGQKFFRIRAVSRINRATNAERKQTFAADFVSYSSGQFAEADPANLGGHGIETGRHDHKFVASHARHIIVFPAGTLQTLGEQAKDAITFQMAKAIIDLLEAIEIADHHSQ